MTTTKPRVVIGSRYEPPAFVHRATSGTYSAKMPEITLDGEALQFALLRQPAKRTAAAFLTRLFGGHHA